MCGTAALVTILLLVFLLSSCGTTQENVDPRQVFDQAVPAMKALKSFHFVYELKRPQTAKPSPGTEISRIVGDATIEGSMKAVVDILQSGIPFQVNLVTVGDTYYVQDPVTLKWHSVPATASPIGKVNLNAGAIQILQRITAPTYVATEQINNVSAHHLRGKVAAVDIAGIVGSVSSTGTLDVEVWIGANDHLVRRIDLTGATTPNESPKTGRTIVITKFNESVTIKAPV